MVVSDAGAQGGPNNPSAPAISPMRPDFTMRPPRSFRDPAAATGTTQQDPVNRDFNELWSRFVSSVSGYDRQASVDSTLRTQRPQAASRRHVRRAARNVAADKANAATPRKKHPAN